MFSVNRICRLCGLSKITYKNHKHPAERFLAKYVQIKKSIEKLTKKTPENLFCHQDQGSQYTSYDYVDLVLKNKIILSYSAPGRPTENPGQESFFGRFKNENRDELLEIRDFNQLKQFLKKKVRYYNQKRIHTGVNCQNPLKFTQDYLKNISLSGD